MAAAAAACRLLAALARAAAFEFIIFNKYKKIWI
jgi:hypothetical protein